MSPDLDVPRGLVSHRFRAMGSDIHVLVPERRAPERADAVEALFEEWEAALSRFRPESELSRLNDRAGAPVRVGPILLAAVEASLAAARATGGLFDPTLRHELVRIGYGRSFDAAALKALAPGSFYTEPAGEAHYAQTRTEAVVVDITGYGPSDTVYTATAK